MSVRQYDEEPFPYQIEAYHELERGQWIEVRRNDVDVAVGSRGVVLKKVAETGNYQVAVEVEGQDTKRVVALCPDQVRPADVPLPEPAAAPESKWSEEKRKAQSQRLKAYWERKRAEKEDPAAAAAAIDEEIAATGAKLAEQAAGILNMPQQRADEVAPSLMGRHRPEGMDERIAEAVHGPEKAPRKLTERPAPEPVAAAAVEPEPEPEVVAAIRHVQGYRERYGESVDLDLLQAIRELRPQPKPAPAPQLVEVTWTKRAADAIRPVLAEAAAAGGDVTQLALLVETISYLEDGGRP